MPAQITSVHSGVGISNPMDAGGLDGDGKRDLVALYYLSYYHNWQTYCMTLWYGRDSGIPTSTEANADFDSATGRDWPHPCGLNKEAYSLGDLNGNGVDELLIVLGETAGFFNINTYESYYSGFVFSGSC